jgi:hypothetical protein
MSQKTSFFTVTAVKTSNLTKYIFLPHHKNAGQKHDINVTYTFYRNVAEVKCMGMTVTNQNLIQEEIQEENAF